MDTKKKGAKTMCTPYREPNGRLARSGRRGPDTPPPAIHKRLTSLGIDTSRLSAREAATLARDPATGTALGRLTWVLHRDGRRERRLDAAGMPIISDEMLVAADIFRAAWVAWSRAEGLPARTARAMAPGPSETSPPPTDAQAAAAVRRWREISEAVKACQQPRLVWAALDAVVIDDTLGRCFRLDDLRAGLEAVAGVG